MINILLFALKTNSFVGHKSTALCRAYCLTQIGLTTGTEFARFTFRNIQRYHDIARLTARHFRAHTLDDAASFMTQYGWEDTFGVFTRQRVPIGMTHTSAQQLDAHFRLFGHCNLNLFNLERLFLLLVPFFPRNRGFTRNHFAGSLKRHRVCLRLRILHHLVLFGFSVDELDYRINIGHQTLLQLLTQQELGMKRNMLLDKTRNKIIAMSISILIAHARLDSIVLAHLFKLFRTQLILLVIAEGQRKIRRTLINQQHVQFVLVRCSQRFHQLGRIVRSPIFCIGAQVAFECFLSPSTLRRIRDGRKRRTRLIRTLRISQINHQSAVTSHRMSKQRDIAKI
mmetsp:Transcript_41385/g.68107  ORF Transcript_41385/g.68107 Transcript_41385/m.68107 type:complete len:340 (+) Transcript_41385:885-1904(+)